MDNLVTLSYLVIMQGVIIIRVGVPFIRGTLRARGTGRCSRVSIARKLHRSMSLGKARVRS